MFLLCGLVIFGIVAWTTGLLNPEPAAGQAAITDQEGADPSNEAVVEEVGDPIKTPLPPDKPLAAGTGADPIVIPGCHLVVIDKADVFARYDGKLLFIGTQVTDRTQFKDPKLLSVKIIGRDGKEEIIYYRRLREGEPVQPDQMVALIDPTLPLNQYANKLARVEAARADWNGSLELEKVYQGEVKRLEEIRKASIRAVAESEYEVAKAQHKKYHFEGISKKEAIQVARKEADEAKVQLDFHYLRNPLRLDANADPNVNVMFIKSIAKNPGEAVKAQETVLHIHNIRRLRAEGLVSVQNLAGLYTGMDVGVEAVRRRRPLSTFPGHRGEITCVAVSSPTKKDPEPYIISGSEDNTARVWKRTHKGELKILRHPAAVRSVACTSAEAARVNWCLTGCADGSVRLWDLDEIKKNPNKPLKPLWVKKDQHTDAVNCLAFSPDGKYYASGGEDNLIFLWNADTGEKVYQFNADKGHQGAVTSLHFTPDLKVVSAGRDNKVLVWTLCKKGARLENDQTLPGRSGTVTSLGVSRDGRYLLYDQGKKLQVMAQAGGRTIGVIQDPSEGAPFETVAAFSPDASLILTTSGTEGRLQLWRSPTDYPRRKDQPQLEANTFEKQLTEYPRIYEVRQFIVRESTAITCAAFGTDETLGETGAEDAHQVFAVTGTREGQVLLWAIPSNQQVKDEKKVLKGTIILRDEFVDPISKQARVWVEVDNIKGQLTPGEVVTVVAYPQGPVPTAPVRGQQGQQGQQGKLGGKQ
jgi:WD40 repeat protein